MTAASRYAKALFELAEDQKQLAALTAPIATLAEILKDEVLHRELHNPKLSPKQRAAYAQAIAADIKAPQLLTGTLGLLAQKNRLSLLPEIVDAFQLRAEEKAGITRLAVQTAQTLTEDQRKHLKALVLKHTKGNDVILTETEQPDLIAGFRASFAGKVWDTSLTTGLARLRNTLTKRFQHTI